MLPALMSIGANVMGAAGAAGGGGGISGLMGGLGSIFKKGMPFLEGLGGLLGGQKSMEYFDQGRGDIQNLPGMSGPANLMGDFGTSVGGAFSFNPAMAGAQSGISSTLPGLFGSQNPFGNVNVLGQYQDALSVLGNPMDPMNAVSSGAAQQLFGQGMGNLASAGNQQGLYNQSLDVMRQAYAPEQQRQQNALLDDLYSKGLLGQNTSTQGSNQFIRNFMESQERADLGFQNQAFDRALAQQQFLGNLGMSQAGQGLGAENQAFQQALAALTQNQTAGMQRLGAAQGLFGLGQDIFAQNYGLGLQGAESLLGYGDFGLRGAALPYQLQAGLLSGSGYHAQALGNLAAQQAEASSGFLGGLFG